MSDPILTLTETAAMTRVEQIGAARLILADCRDARPLLKDIGE